MLQLLAKAKDDDEYVVMLIMLALLLPVRLAWLALRHPVRTAVVVVAWWLFQRAFLLTHV